MLHADETPVAMLDPGAGKTKKAYIWAYARGERSIRRRASIYEFCLGPRRAVPGRASWAHRETVTTAGWRGTLVRDEYGGYDERRSTRKYPGRIAAGCLAHARRKFDELIKRNASDVAPEAIKRIARIYRVERELDGHERAAAPGRSASS